MRTNGSAIGWGVLGPGRIARSFATDLLLVEDGDLVATGSRSLERAEEFNQECAGPAGARAYGSYEELVADPAVEAIYIASPHSEHARQSILAIQAGKPVLVEKSFTQTAEQARVVRELGCDKGQGWFFGKPMEGPALALWLASRSPALAAPCRIAETERARAVEAS